MLSDLAMRDGQPYFDGSDMLIRVASAATCWPSPRTRQAAEQGIAAAAQPLRRGEVPSGKGQIGMRCPSTNKLAHGSVPRPPDLTI